MRRKYQCKTGVHVKEALEVEEKGEGGVVRDLSFRPDPKQKMNGRSSLTQERGDTLGKSWTGRDTSRGFKF